MATIPKETQRITVALTVIIGFYISFLYIFHTTRDMETARTILSILAGSVSSIVGYFFGVKTAERRGE